MSSSQGYPLPHRLSFINRPTIRPVAHRTHTFLSFFLSFLSGDPLWFCTPTTFLFRSLTLFIGLSIVNLAGPLPLRQMSPPVVDRRVALSARIGIGRLWCWSSVSSLSLICMEICVEKIFETDILKICWNGNLLATLVALLASFIDELRPTINTIYHTIYMHIYMCVCLWIILGCALIYALDRIRLA